MHTCEEGGTPNEPLPARPLPMEDGVVDDGVVSPGGLQPRGLDHKVAVLHRCRTRYCNDTEGMILGNDRKIFYFDVADVMYCNSM